MNDSHDLLGRTKKTVALAHACSVSIDQAIRTAQRVIGGVVVDAKLKGKPEHVLWRIKLLTAEGCVKVYIDARSGEILEAWAAETLVLAS